jgi:hypothetical protein
MMEKKRMSRLGSAHCVLLLALSILVTGPPWAISDDGLARRFLQEAPEKWREHESGVNSVSATGNTTMSWDDGHYRKQTLRIVLGANEAEGVFDSQLEEPDRSERSVYGSNAAYSFELTGPISGELSLRAVWARSEKSVDPSRAVEMGRNIVSKIRRLGHIDLLDMVVSPDFSVTSAKGIMRGDQMLVELEFQYDPADPSHAELAGGILRHGTLVLSPDRDWAVLEADVFAQGATPDDSLTKRFTRQVRADITGTPMVVDAHDVAFDAAGNLVYEFRDQYEWSPFTGDAAVFRLSAYGFPEPSFDGPRRARVWMVIGSLIVLFVCLVLALRVRRATVQ